MVEEDVTIMGDILVVLEAKEIQVEEVSEVTEVQLQEAEALEAIEIQLREKVDLEEVNQEVHLLQDAKADFHQIDHQEQVIFLTELQDVLRVRLIDQEKEDQEEANAFC